MFNFEQTKILNYEKENAKTIKEPTARINQLN